MTIQGNKNLLKLVIGQALLLISFTIYSTVLLYLLVQQYHANARIIAIFGGIAALPPALIILLSPILGQIKNNKKVLINLQLISTIAILVGGIFLIEHIDLFKIAILYFILSAVNTISESVEVGFIPVVFQENEALIEKSVDFQYFMSSGITIIASIISSFVLKYDSIWLLVVSFISAPLGIIFYWLISYDVTFDLPKNEPENEFEQSYLKEMIDSLYQFSHTMPAFLIILFEAILGGITGLLFDLLPLTMKELGLAVAMFSIVNAVQKIGDLVGGMFAPLVKWKAPTFFAFDYIISGGCFIAVTFPINNFIRLALLLIAGIVMGMSGNVFEKLMYRSFNVGNISAMHALATSTFALFSVVSYLAAWINVKTLILWQMTGIITIIFGVIIIFYRYKK
ncbi:hypothetical protein [Companilactobacillus alimentarius]|uniref:MFS transporter n=1 Tax=Companilactobacillus alimentarius DSM 20249 TaxID=1423720 RepID=A0A2K9HNQ6_9LACO|nr:hypothetical protein [Companilactobacillus alimentarius]AUI70812.1 hypothetical protein LA20249_00715 [Companilactobacillus alimentarius DSM 20249]KRK77613.1 hypothetical protein FC67_GL000204 [Companilactobacillus alimentarius DSM 20249]GEO45232.1 hypothetical protein LAL01_14640 [Companilactobacillus alimentarius]